MPVSYLGTEGILNGLNVGDPFFNQLGATISERTFCDSGACTAYAMTIGATAGVDPESLVHSRYIVIWACNMISTNLHLWPFVAEAQRRGAKVVVIDPVRHRTAQHADWHIPIRPGTDGALALAMMHVIIAEGLIDEDYVRDHTVGYRRARRARAAVHARVGGRGDRGPGRRHPHARPRVRDEPTVDDPHRGGGRAARRRRPDRARDRLPARAGRRVAQRRRRHAAAAAVGVPGELGRLMHPELATPGTRVVNQFLLGEALTGEMALDPPINGLVVYNSNPWSSAPTRRRWPRGLAREDLFTVVSEHFLTDTARYADIVLPATTQLEQLDIMFSWGHFYVSLNPPAIEPARRGGVQHRAVPPARRPDGLRRRVVHPQPTRR